MKIVIALSIFLLINTTLGIDFAFKLGRNKMECFSEPLNPDTLVKLSISADDPNYQEYATRIYDDEAYVYTEEPLIGSVVKHTFTTKKEGNIHICLTNTGPRPTRFNFELTTGIEAGDITYAASDKDLQPIDKQLQKLERLMTSVKKTTSFIVAKEDRKMAEVDSIPSKLYLYSFITLAILLSVSYLQIKYLKNFFKNKKLI